jgi:hypothetical protein
MQGDYMAELSIEQKCKQYNGKRVRIVQGTGQTTEGVLHSSGEFETNIITLKVNGSAERIYISEIVSINEVK